jgi:hypothetical protein
MEYRSILFPSERGAKAVRMPKRKAPNSEAQKEKAYRAVVLGLFEKHYQGNGKPFEFAQSEYDAISKEKETPKIGNKPDLVYQYRFRRHLPPEIEAQQPPGRQWVIELSGRGKYTFVLRKLKWITPTEGLVEIKVPDQTPEIIKQYARTDEQALLARVRYNRLIDVFLGITTSSLQNHLRASVRALKSSQIEIDELYIGLNSTGTHFVIPVQAKGGTDHLAAVQARQDLLYCAEQFPHAACKAVSAQFVDTGDDEKNYIVLFEVALEGLEEVVLVRERRYRLVSRKEITPEDLEFYKTLHDDHPV